MATLTGTIVLGLMNLSTALCSVAEMENLIDVAIDTLNLFGAPTIDYMTGTTPTKTITLTSKQRGSVLLVVRNIYYGLFRGKDTVSAGGVTITASDVLANPEIVKLIKLAAKKLQTVSFGVGEDTSGLGS